MTIIDTLNSKKLLTPEAIEAVAQYCEENETLVLSALPFFAAEIADCLGFKDAITLIARFGGGNVKIPHTPRSGTNLCKSIGQEAATKFIERFGGGDMYVPSPKGVLKILQREEMKRQRREGASIRVLTERFDVSERTVVRITKGLGPNARAAE